MKEDRPLERHWVAGVGLCGFAAERLVLLAGGFSSQLPCWPSGFSRFSCFVFRVFVGFKEKSRD